MGITGKVHERLIAAFAKAGRLDHATWGRRVDCKTIFSAGVWSQGFAKVFRPVPTVPTDGHRLRPIVTEEAPYVTCLAYEAACSLQISRPPVWSQPATAFSWCL